MGWKKTLLLSTVILIVAAAILGLIFTTEPEATRSATAKETAMLVDVVSAEQGNFNPVISATGTVQPAQEIMLGAQVDGEVIYRYSNFVPGGYVNKGEVLLQIDSTDYVNELMQAKSELRQAQSSLQQEMGLQEAAKREYELLDDTLSGVNRALILREPQLNSVKSQVKAAEAAVNQAERNLERTTIRAPFNANIIARNVNQGSLVSPGQNLGQLVGLDTYWVETTVALDKLRWLNFQDEEVSSEVRIRNRTAWSADEYRTGYLFRMIGSLEPQTRMARVLIEVEDPMSIKAENRGKPSLIIGSFVQTNIEGRSVENVFKVHRDHIRSNETVWVKEGDSLQIRDVDIVLQDADFAYVSSGLETGDHIITTNLASVTEGAPLRLEGEEPDTTEDGAEE